MILNLYHIQYEMFYKDELFQNYLYEETIKAENEDSAAEKLIEKVYAEEIGVVELYIYNINCLTCNSEE